MSESNETDNNNDASGSKDDYDNSHDLHLVGYINESLRMLQQARAKVLNSPGNSTSSQSFATAKECNQTMYPSPSYTSSTLTLPGTQSNSCSYNRGAAAENDFKKSFPGLCGRNSGKTLQTFLPNYKVANSNRGGGKSGRGYATATSVSRFSPYVSAGKTAQTWTHDFVCLSELNTTNSPNLKELQELRLAGLGKKKIVFKDKNGLHGHVRQTLESYFPRLKSQNGAFHLCKANAGGYGKRELIILPVNEDGFTVQGLKVEVRSCAIYIVPLNSSIDSTPISIYESSTVKVVKEQLCVCSKCNNEVSLMEFKSHAETCHAPLTSKPSIIANKEENERMVENLTKIFPDTSHSDIASVVDTCDSMEDAVESLLAKTESSELPDSSLCSSRTESIPTSFGNLEELLSTCQQELVKDEVYKLDINRDELWRMALACYKKAISRPQMLKKSLEVQFSSDTGEGDSTDAGAIRVEFFHMMFDELDKRLLEGSAVARIPRRGDSINFVILGIVIGHSLLNGGPGFYRFKAWVYEYIVHFNDSDHMLKVISKDDIPLNAGTEELIKFITALDAADSAIGSAIDSHLQILNCSQWDPATSVTTLNKGLLIAELLFEELIRKRTRQIKSVREGLSLTGILKLIECNPNICKEIFVAKQKVMTKEAIFELFEKDTFDKKSDFEKQQTTDFFIEFINNSTETILKEILKFTTGFSSVPPWGFNRKASLKFLLDDDEKIYPEAMACFYILYLPTVHSSQKAFNEHFECALRMEGHGFSAAF